MKFKKSGFYSVIFIIVILAQLYVPSFKLNIAFQIAVLGVYIILEKLKISKNFLSVLLPIAAIFFMGFIGTIIYRYEFINVIKDITYFIKPLLSITIGYLFFKTVDNRDVFIKSIIKSGIISAIIHLFIVMFFTDFLSGSVSAIRMFTKDNMLEMAAFFMLIYHKHLIGKPFMQSRVKYYAVFSLLLISIILYFSRTMIIFAIILLLSVYGYTIITLKTIKFLSFIVLFTGVLYLFLFTVNIKRDAPGAEGFLYKIKMAPAEVFDAKIDREDHSKLWDHWRAYEAKRALSLLNESKATYISGTGYGSLVNLKFAVPVDGDTGNEVRYISGLHNGYINILYKTGIAGFLLYIIFLIRLYKYIYFGKTFEAVFISAFSLTYAFTTLIITGIYNKNDIIVIIAGALLYFHEKYNKESNSVKYAL